MSELKDRDILDLIGQPVFIADTETHELLYMNQAAMDFFHVKDYQGKTCHQAIHGLEQPCSFCNAAHLEASEHYLAAQASAAWEAAVCWRDAYAIRRLAEVNASDQ